MKLQTYSPYIVLSHYTAYHGIPVTKLNHLTSFEDIHYPPLSHASHTQHTFLTPVHASLPYEANVTKV